MSLPVLELITKISLKTWYKINPSHIQCYYPRSSTELDNAIQVGNCSMPEFFLASTFRSGVITDLCSNNFYKEANTVY